MDYNEYIGKGWSYTEEKNSRNGIRVNLIDYFIIDVRIVTDKRPVKDENGRTVFEQVPHKKGSGSKTVMKMEEVKVPAMLAIKVKHSGDSSRYSITNPTAKYSVSDSFFKNIKREKENDNMPRECLIYLFEKGVDKWKKRYSGYKNLFK
ncbi:MAG: hypothetical protein ACOCRO_00850 [Halanaerobiales bacterium]